MGKKSYTYEDGEREIPQKPAKTGKKRRVRFYEVIPDDEVSTGEFDDLWDYSRRYTR